MQVVDLQKSKDFQALGVELVSIAPDPGEAWRDDGEEYGLVLRPEIAALSMSGSSFLVALNALLLKRLRLPAAKEVVSG